METRNQVVHPERYNRINKPPSREEAVGRADFLKENILEVKDQLELTNITDFPSQDEYASWRRRAIKALSMMKNELKFIESWLAGIKEAARTPEAKEEVEEVRVYAMMLVDEISGEYTQVYSRSRPPLDKAAAQVRMSELAGCKTRIQAGFSDIKARLAVISGTASKASAIVTAPLHQLLSEVEIEVSVVRGFLRSEAVTENTWIGLFARALVRAVSEGFVLMPDESQALAAIRQREGI